jgi:hypothetical protein
MVPRGRARHRFTPASSFQIEKTRVAGVTPPTARCHPAPSGLVFSLLSSFSITTPGTESVSIARRADFFVELRRSGTERIHAFWSLFGAFLELLADIS